MNWRVQATALLLYLSYLQTGAQTAFLTGKRPITTQGFYSNTGTYYKAQHCTSLITRSVHIKENMHITTTLRVQPWRSHKDHASIKINE